MSQNHHVVLIHGTWGNGRVWEEVASWFSDMGFLVHAPTLRFHDLALEEGAAKLGAVSLRDYVNDLCELVTSLDSPPIIVGHSLGGLLAQLVAARVPHKGLVLLAPAPSPGIFVPHPSIAKIFTPYFLRWAFWRKPMLPPDWDTWVEGIVNEQPLEIQQRHYAELCAESGRIYFEMVFWFLDWRRAASVKHEAVRTPVLVIGATEDRAVHAEIARLTAARFVGGQHIELQGSDHMMVTGHYVPQLMQHIEHWLGQNHLMVPSVACHQSASWPNRRCGLLVQASHACLSNLPRSRIGSTSRLPGSGYACKYPRI